MVEKPDFSSLNFLIVDDHAFVREMVKRVLASLNPASIREAHSGTTALDVLVANKGKINVVLCDW